MSLRRVLHARVEGRTSRIGPEIQQLEILFVLPTEGYGRHAAPDRINVEFDRSVAERNVLEHRVTAVQPHQAVIKTQFPQELRVVLNLPVVSRHGNRDRLAGRFRGLDDRHSQQKACADRHIVQDIFADTSFHGVSVGTAACFGEQNVTKRT